MKHLLTFLFFLFLLPALCFAQTEKALFTGQVFTYVEHMPEPDFVLSDFLKENITYPEQAAKENIDGRVIVKFVVDTTGAIHNVTVVRGVHPLLDSESVRVIRLMPKWKPGMQNGKAVNVYYSMPVSFKLDDHELMELVKPKGKKRFEYVNKMPVPGFDVDSFISANLHYPETEKAHGISGEVIVKFQINEDGSVSRPMIAGSVYESLDEEAKRVISLMPPWKPALINREPVAVFMPVRVVFKPAVKIPQMSLVNILANQFRDLEQMPEPGFDINKYLRDHIKYPEAARDNGIQGKLLVVFTVDENGNILYVHTPKPVNVLLDKEARKIVENMPRWKKAGVMDGKGVKVFYTLPISFRLE